MIVIHIISLATGEPSSADDSFVKSFDPLWNGNGLGVGHLIVTREVDHALKFSSLQAAWEFWKQESPTVPRRPDGKPNRPLTCWTIELIEESKLNP